LTVDCGLSTFRAVLKVDASLNHIPAGREHVIALFESINQPLVNIPSFGTAPTGAFVLGTRNEYGYYTVFVYLHQQETRAVVVYISEPRNLTAELYRTEEQEAIRFVESMGFMIDNIHFPTLAPSEQEAVMARIPMFRPPEQTMNLYDTVEDSHTSFPPIGSQPGGRMTDAMFGGMSAQDGDVFRRMGLEPKPSPPTLNPPSNPFQFSPPSQPQYSPPPQPQFNLPAPQKPPALSPEALARIGKLLGTFALLGSLAMTGSCQSGGAGGVRSIEDRKTIESHLDLGNQHLVRSQIAEAIQNFDVVLTLDETNRDAFRGKGMAYLRLGRFQEAEDFYRKAMTSDPSWSEPKNELAVLLMETKRCAEAEELLMQVRTDIFYRTPEFAEHNLAKALECQGRDQEALGILEDLVLKRPTFCLAYLTLAQLAARTKQPEATIDACEGFFTNCEQNEEIKEQISPEHVAMCYLKKGTAHAALGDVESARASFKRCQTSGTYGSECRRSLNLLPP
jgi:Tfp pilus assembly protein PilF